MTLTMRIVMFLCLVAPPAGASDRTAAVSIGAGLTCATADPAAAPAAPAATAARAPALDGEALGEQRTLITLINFADDPSTPFTAADVEGAILDAADPASTASWVAEASYGRAWLTGDVVDWVTMPWNDDPACLLAYGGQTQTIVDELDPLIDFAAYDRWLIFIPQNAGCPFSGYSSLGKMTLDSDEGVVRLSRVVMNGFGPLTNLLGAHELGHSFAGLQHSLDYECGAETIADFCAPAGLGSLTDPYDVLGVTAGGGHFTAPNKDALGWFGPDVVESTAPGGSYSLLPYASSAPGPKALRIPVRYDTSDTARTLNYYVSYRTPLGFDAGFADLGTDGATLHADSSAWLDDAPRWSRLLDTSPNVNADAAEQAADSGDSLLRVGQTYVDDARGIAIAVTGVTDGRLDVTVTIAKYCGNGAVDPALGEACDGADLGAATCGGIGHLDGRLACAADCTFDTDRCGLDLCGPGHDYDPAGRCRATFLADRADGSLWRSRPSFTEARESPWANNFTEENWISILTTQRADGWTWFHKGTLPFDTSTLPDGATILAADLLLKFVLAGGIANSHPDSADQLVLVHPTLAGPPQADRLDYPNYGALDAPEEGAPRIDVGDEVALELIKTWPLNATGLQWIDPAGWSVFGIRPGFEADDVQFAGVPMDLHVQIRSSHSFSVGPRLVVEYASAAVPPTGAAGAVSQLTLDRTATGDVALAWGPSCATGDSDYEIYEGALGDFTSHLPRTCSTGGATAATVTPAAGSSYYLVVPRSADREGSYGVDGAAAERAPAASACVPQQLGVCGG